MLFDGMITQADNCTVLVPHMHMVNVFFMFFRNKEHSPKLVCMLCRHIWHKHNYSNFLLYTDAYSPNLIALLYNDTTHGLQSIVSSFMASNMKVTQYSGNYSELVTNKNLTAFDIFKFPENKWVREHWVHSSYSMWYSLSQKTGIIYDLWYS